MKKLSFILFFFILLFSSCSDQLYQLTTLRKNSKRAITSQIIPEQIDTLSTIQAEATIINTTTIHESATISILQKDKQSEPILFQNIAYSVKLIAQDPSTPQIKKLNSLQEYTVKRRSSRIRWDIIISTIALFILLLVPGWFLYNYIDLILAIDFIIIGAWLLLYLNRSI